MRNLRSWACSWPFILSIISFTILVSAIHLFLTPLFPSPIDFFARSNPKAESLDFDYVLDLDLKSRFPPDSHGAVTYRNAPWKAEIGRWLSGCDSNSTAIDIIEVLSSRSCENNCSGQGICNHDLGECRCFHGFDGKRCERALHLECNLPGSEIRPFGPWIVSICPAHCDTSRALCFCGQGSKYPHRPVPESCGFKIIPPQNGKPKLTDWYQADKNIFTTNISEPGWCNVDPTDAYSSRVKFKEECDCKYDCLWGRFCEVPTVCSCLNQCSGNGLCRGGFCQCESGYYGIDCSIPTSQSLSQSWPSFLQPSQTPPVRNSTGNDINITGDDDSVDGNIKVVVRKRRPLVYVYDLPPEFNSHLMEGRHYKLECVNRIYNENNRTLWTPMLYGAQVALYESILASPHRTLNADEADYFYVPVLDSCLITRADDAPHLRMREHGHLRSHMTLDYYKMAYDHIAEKYPFWNRSSGRDHIWFFSWDEGACYAPKEIRPGIMLSHWGNTNTKHPNSTTAYWADMWDSIPSSKRGFHPCFDPTKDLVLPAWKPPNPGALWLKLWERPRKERTTLFYFNGNLGPAYENGRPEDTYSMGIRQKLAAQFGSTPNKQGKLGKQHTANITVTPLRAQNYYEEISRAVFCGVLPGDGWSGRMEDSVMNGCIPVIIQDGIFLPYENVLNYESFAVRILEDDIPKLVTILKGYNETEIEHMLSNVRKIWQRFLYKDSILLEAKRQRKLFSQDEDWAVGFSKLGDDDDVFATFIQVLHYKLHNDPWRKTLLRKYDSGLPKTCSRS
ncbi:hypothetical protein LUZ60_006009 [Juncus effusus]|nr:hypothetical protein LUZ60_006009 [Juncus effusus]